jgi:hypothetical protein
VELMLRHPEATSDDNNDKRIEETIKLLSDEQVKAEIKGNDEAKNGGDGSKPPAPKNTDTNPVLPPTPAAAPEKVKVLFANRDIPVDTEVTVDVIQAWFDVRELPKGLADDALLDLRPALGKAFKVGVAKGQWLTPTMVGLPALKAPPRDVWVDPKLGGTTDVKPATVPGKRKTLDVQIHTTTTTMIHRYEEVAPGVWKKTLELTPEQAAQLDKAEAQKGAPDARKPD